MSQSGVRTTLGRPAATAGNNPAITTTATIHSTSDLRVRSLRMVRTSIIARVDGFNRFARIVQFGIEFYL